jgi:hypothetical protein
VAELLALDEVLGERVHDGDSLALEGVTHLNGVGQGIAMVVEADGAR